MSVQTEQSAHSGILWKVWTTLVQSRQKCNQATRQRCRSQRFQGVQKFLAFLAIATSATGQSDCTAAAAVCTESACTDNSVCTAFRTFAFVSDCNADATGFSRVRRPSPCISAAISADSCHAFISGVICTAVDTRSHIQPSRLSASVQCTAFPAAAHSTSLVETIARSVRTESICDSTASRTTAAGTAFSQKHAVKTACGGQSFGQSRKTYFHHAKNHPAEHRRLVQICGGRESQGADRPSSMHASSSQCRTRTHSCTSGFAAATASHFRACQTDVCAFAGWGTTNRTSHAYGSRWGRVFSTLDSATTSVTCLWISSPVRFAQPSTSSPRCSADSYASSSISAASPVCYAILEFQYAQCIVATADHQWILHPTWISKFFGASCDGFRTKSVWSSHASHATTCTSASTRFNRTFSCASRPITERGAISTRFTLDAAGQFCFRPFVSSRSSAMPLYCHTTSTSSAASCRIQRARRDWFDSTAFALRSTGRLAVPFTANGTSSCPLWYSLHRSGTETGTGLVRTSQSGLPCLGPEARSRHWIQRASGRWQSAVTANDCFSSRGSQPAIRVPSLLHTMANGPGTALATISSSGPASTEPSRHCSPKYSSPCHPKRSSSSQCISVFFSCFSGGCRYVQSHQGSRWKCARSGSERSTFCQFSPSPRGHRSHKLGMRPLLAMQERAEDEFHGLHSNVDLGTAECGAPFPSQFLDRFQVEKVASWVPPVLRHAHFSASELRPCASSVISQCSVGVVGSPIRLRLDPLLEPVAPNAKQFWTLRNLVSQVQTRWPLDFLSQDLLLAVQVLPDLSAELRAFFATCTMWSGELVKVVHLFTDGSASQWTLSAWAMVVVYECVGDDNNHSSRFLFRGFAGSILHDLRSWVNHGLSVGEEDHDALTAELVGLTWALGWALQDDVSSEFVCHYDNLSAGNGIFGLWNPPQASKYAQLVRSGTCLRQMLDCKASCHGKHVPAHTGAPWNELADSVAKALAKRVLPSSILPVSLPKLLHHPLLEHAWTEIAVQGALDLRSSVEWPTVYKREGPSNPLSADPFWKPPMQLKLTTSDRKPLVVQLRIGTANVLTLDCGAQMHQRSGKLLLGRIGFLQKQFSALGLHILGLQETRSSGQHTRHSRDWWVFQSGCTDQGTHGIELWFHRNVPYGQNGTRALFFQQHHFTVLAFHARFLLIEVAAPALQLHVLCMHCPFAQSMAMEPSTFWETVENTLNCRKNQHWPLVVLGDFNAKLGSIQSEAVSSHQAEAETPVGTLMHQFMLGRTLCAPATFSTCHKTAGFTWRVGSPAQSRLDYVLVPQSWLPSVEASEVHYDVELLTEDDHHLVSLSLRLSLRDTQPRYVRPPRPCPHKLKDPEIAREFLAAVARLEFVPWTFGTGLHCELLTSKLQELCSRFFSSSYRRPLQQHLSDNTWNLVTLRHFLLRTIRRLDVLLRKLCCWTHLVSWAGRYRELRHSEVSQPCVDFASLVSLRSSAFLLKLDLIALRSQLKGPARKACRQDRLHELKSIAVRFANSASLSNSGEVHRHLKPLLGPHGRKSVLTARPLPAIRMASGQFAQSRDELASTWQNHFAAIEGGSAVTSTELSAAVCAFSHVVFPGDQSPALDLQALPTLTQIETVIRRSRAHKAPGPDQLPASIFKLDPVLFARLLYPLYLKIGIRCHEPIRFRGGEIMALAKKAHSQFQCTDFRAIVLADQLGKYHHTIQRQKLLPYFAEFRAPMQAGCSKGIGVDHVHLQLEAYSDWAVHRKRSFCVLFVDVASAYYKAVRPFIVDGFLSDEQIARMFVTNGWQPALLHDFLAALNAPAAFQQAGVTDHLQFQIRSCLQSTWFSLRQMPETLTRTSQGTRPGNPLADLLFAFLFSRVNHQILEQMDLAGLLDRFPLRWMPGVPLEPEEQVLCTPGIGSWADDLYLATTVTAASDLRTTAQVLCAIAIDVSASFGLYLNLGIDKTNLLMIPRGVGSFDFKRSIAAESNPSLQVSTRALGTVFVQIVRDYIHLGSLFDGLSNKPELHRRLVLSMPLAKHLRKPVFGNFSLSLPLRGMLLQSYVLSRFLFGCATWHFRIKQDYQSWFTALAKLYGMLLPPHLKGPGFSSLDLVACTGQLHPALLLAKHRLALLSRMFEPHLVSVWSILQAAPTWCEQILADLVTIQQSGSRNFLVGF